MNKKSLLSEHNYITIMIDTEGNENFDIAQRRDRGTSITIWNEVTKNQKNKNRGY